MKVCAKCRESKDTSLFNKDNQKKDGLRVYCRDCEKIIQKRKHERKKMEEQIADTVKYPNESPREMSKKENEEHLVKFDTSVESLARMIGIQYNDDIKKADEIYELFYNRISGGDGSQASKEALTKSLELRMSASESLTKLIQIAAKFQETVVKSKSKDNIIIDNIKDDFDLD